MELLNSSWLIHLIEGAGKKPSDKLLSLYSLLNTWLNAPGIRAGIVKDYSNGQPLVRTCPALTAHLLSLATEARLRNPSSVVTQMMILLQGGIAEELRNPGMGALISAQQAARAVLSQAKPRLIIRLEKTIKISGYAASMAIMSILAVHFWPSASSTQVRYAQHDGGYQQAAIITTIEPELLLKAFALKKSMESGTCPAPNFFSIPKDQLPAYMNVVQARLSNNPELDSQRLAAFLTWYEQNRAWECYSKTQNKQKIILGMGV